MSRYPESPIRELLSLRDRMTRLFEESMGRFQDAAEGLSTHAWSPAVDIFEEPDRLVLRFDLAGVPREDVQVVVEEGALVIQGERFVAPGLRAEDFHRMERSYGPFQRVFRLPADVAEAEIAAEMRDGVLDVVVPRRQGSPGGPIRVEVR